MISIDNCTIQYRYSVRMPNATGSVKTVYNKLQSKHFKNIMDGRDKVLVSPIYHYDKNKILWQPLFDLDVKKCKSVKLLVENVSTIRKFFKLPHHIEITNNGVHIVYHIAFNLSDRIQLDYIRNKLRKLNLTCLDIPSSVKDLPIFRIGSYREDQHYTIIPITGSTFNDAVFFEYRKKANGKPIEIYNEQTWHNLFSKFIFAKDIIGITQLELIFEKIEGR